MIVFLEANSYSSVVTVEIPMEINKLNNLQRLVSTISCSPSLISFLKIEHIPINDEHTS